jgi:hypothetical protein
VPSVRALRSLRLAYSAYPRELVNPPKMKEKPKSNKCIIA